MAIFVRDRAFYRSLIALAAPIALKSLISLSVSLADNIMVGSLGSASLGGAFMANQLTTLFTLILGDVCAAIVVLSAQYWGKRDTTSMKSVLTIGMYFAMGLSLLAFVMGFFFTETTLSLYTKEAAVISEGVKYLKVISVSFLFMFLTETLMASMRSAESVKIALCVSCSTFVINLFLNWVLIYGNLGAPALGIQGAAIATLTARIVECLIMVFYVRRVDQKLKIRFTQLKGIDRAMLKDFIKYGIPVIMGGVIWGLNMNAQGIIIGHLGSEAAISSVSVANTLFQVMSVVVYGVAGGTGILIGKTVGSGDIEKVKQYAKTLQFIFIGLGLIQGTMIFASRQLVGYIWTALDAETLRMVKQFLAVLSVTSVGTAYQMSSLTGIVRAGGATNFVFINDTIWVWCVVIPSAAIAAFVFHVEPWLVFALLKGDQIYKCAVAVIKVNRFKWIKVLTRA